jgi:hypothetical protein
MSIREQERRQKEAERRIDERMRAADRRVRGSVLARQKAADLRANDVIKRIEKGSVDPRPLPSLREDSMASMESTPSMESSPSIASIESAEPVSAGEDLAQRVTEDTDAGGDPHEHNERKAGEMARQMTEDTNAAGDMTLHAERKAELSGDQKSEA